MANERELIELKIFNAKSREDKDNKEIFKTLKDDNDIMILAKNINFSDYYYDDIENKQIEEFWIYLKDTNGIYFILDNDFNIIKINEIPIENINYQDIDISHKHTFIEESTIGGDDCLNPVSKVYGCKTCDKEYKLIIEEAIAHEWGDWEETLEPKCVEKGKKVRICNKCSTREEQDIPELGHKPSDTWSYTAEGHYKSCERCGEISVSQEPHDNMSLCSVCQYKGTFNVLYDVSKMTYSNETKTVNYGQSYSTKLTPINSLAYQRPTSITIRMGGNIITTGYEYNNVDGTITINNISGDIVISAIAERYYGVNTSFTNAEEISANTNISASIDQSYRLRIFKFVPETTGSYKFYSSDSSAANKTIDPYAYLFDETTLDTDALDALALEYSKAGDKTSLDNSCLVKDDDSGGGYNFSFTYNCEAGKTYYLAIRTYTPDKIQSFSNIYINKV